MADGRFPLETRPVFADLYRMRESIGLRECSGFAPLGRTGWPVLTPARESLPEMYESFFQFRDRPFPSAPRPDLYFPAAGTERALQTLARCVDRGEGPAVLVGAAGTGKSLVCQSLAERFNERFHVALLSSGHLDAPRALLQNILFELNLPYRGLEEGELRLSLIDFLEPGKSDRDGMLLVVDEAHTLPLELLEEIRMITNLVRHGLPRVRLVLAGGHALEEQLADPKLESLNQRVAARCYLQSLSYDETRDYVRAQIAAVGGELERVFTDSALDAIYQATDGVPRLINQVCDHALMLASVAQRQPADAGLIEEAWADIQQLPAPWHESASADRPADSVIEFGALDEPAGSSDLESDASDAHRWQDSMAEEEGRSVEGTAAREVAGAAAIDLTERLDQIEQRVAEVESDAGAASETDAEGQAAQACVPQVQVASEPVEQASSATAASISTPNPFDEPFEQEEIVVDPYARLRMPAESSSPLVTSQQQQELAAAAQTIFQHANVAMPGADAAPEPAGAEGDIDETAGPAACEAEAPCAAETAPRAVAGEPEEESAIPMPCPSPASEENGDEARAVVVGARVMRAPPPDDSDLIVVVDDQDRDGGSDRLPGNAHRQEYRQLFSRLREG